ncbi:hypothetical protein O9993_01975 [Vibrio lentus]|nr:hypothetical protein [Vibrio lentus]
MAWGLLGGSMTIVTFNDQLAWGLVGVVRFITACDLRTQLLH